MIGRLTSKRTSPIIDAFSKADAQSVRVGTELMSAYGRKRTFAISGIHSKASIKFCPFFMVLSNCLVMNQYYRHAKAVGTTPVWTDAVFELAEAPAIQQAPVYVMDWGIMDSLRLLGEGDLDLRVGWERFTQDGGEQAAAKWVADPRQAESHSLFIFRVAEQEIFRGVSDRFQQALSAGNVNRFKEAVISDRHGRPMFEIWRLIPRP